MMLEKCEGIMTGDYGEAKCACMIIQNTVMKGQERFLPLRGYCKAFVPWTLSAYGSAVACGNVDSMGYR